MDGHNAAQTSQFTFIPRHVRNSSHSNDRQLSESSSNHPRHIQHPPISEPRQTYHNHHSSMQAEQRLPITTQRHTTSPTIPLHHPSKLAKTSSALHFDYHTRYPSPPPTQGSFPAPSISPAFPYPSSLSVYTRDRVLNDRRHSGSSPPRHPSPPPPTRHRTNESSSSADNSPMITLPPLSVHRPLMHPGVDQPPNQHVELHAVHRKPSITQLSRDHPEQPSSRRHTFDSSSFPVPFYHPPGTQPVPPPPQPGQSKLTSRRYSTPPPPISHPPASVRSPRPPSPSTSQPQQTSQSPQLPSQPAITDDSAPVFVTSIDEAADAALEPLRLGFENVWTQTVQNVRQVMSKMQKDFARLNAAEQRKNVNLMRCLVSNSEKLKGQEWAVEELRKEKSSLMNKALQNEQVRRESNQKIDSLSRENHELRRENEELRKKNEEVKEALTRATEFIFQYKEELAKVRADAETFRKCREASMLSANDQTMSTTDLHREITRLHAEKERERIFNDAVKQLRALTALEGSPTRERDSEEAVVALTLSNRVDDCHTGPSSLEVSTLKQNPSSPSTVAQVHCTIDERLRSSTPLSPTQVVSTDNEDKTKVEVDEPDSHEMGIVDVEMDDEDDVTIVPPITSVRATTTSPSPPDTEQNIQLTDECREDLKEESESQSDVEMQRQRRRRARRDLTSPSPSSVSSQADSRKPSPVLSKTGMKRDRQEYEEGQVDEEHRDQDVRIDVVQGEPREEDSVQGSISAETETNHTDVDNSEEGEIVVVEREHKGNNMPKRRKGKKVSTDGGQVTLQKEIQISMTPTFSTANPKATGRWAYYTHYRDSASAPVPPTRSFTATAATTQPSTATLPLSPSPPARLPKKLGINHMDLLYKTEKEVMMCRICLSLEQSPDATTAERRKAKASTKKFPLNASWADLINHCQTEHSKACEDMEKLSPSQLAEMKQRMPPVVSTR